MRSRLTLIAAVAIVCGAPVLALAQPPQPPSLPRNGGVGAAGTGLGTGFGVTTPRPPLVVGRGGTPAATGGVMRLSNHVTGGIVDGITGSAPAGAGGVQDTKRWGSSTGGIVGSGRGQSASTGGVRDGFSYGRATGGIAVSQSGAGAGGIGNLDSLGTETGGLNEENAQRPQTVQ
jgi:hypothetical protein